jgi:hypothetical protein
MRIIYEKKIQELSHYGIKLQFTSRLRPPIDRVVPETTTTAAVIKASQLILYPIIEAMCDLMTNYRSNCCIIHVEWSLGGIELTLKDASGEFCKRRRREREKI